MKLPHWFGRTSRGAWRVARLVAEADLNRDRGDRLAAADLYGRAADLDEGRWDLRVQQANMLKDAGRFAEAEALYRRCIAARPRDADVRLQLGHALKLAGDRAGAVASYEAALMLDPGCDAARRELVEIGHAERHAERIDAMARGVIGEPLTEMLARIAALQTALADLRARLPEIVRLGVFPLSCYDVFREMWPRLPDPPAHPPVRALFLLRPREGRPDDAHAGLAGALAQRCGDWRMIGFGSVSLETLEPAARAEPRVVLADARPDAAAVAAAFDGWTPDWVIPLIDGASPDPGLLGWLAAAAALQPAAGFVTDEETRAADAFGRMRCSAPRLRRWPDRDGALSGELIGATPILSVESWAARPEADLDEAVAAAALDLAWDGALAHLPLPLIHRAEVPDLEPSARHLARVETALRRRGATETRVAPSPADPAVLRCDWPEIGARRLSVIIPTRDNPGELAEMTDSLARRAARPGRVEILVLDNGDAPSGAASRRRLAMPGPFNWSAFNNAAAAETAGEILVFANDDMRMLTDGWDARLAGLLGRAEIGVVGARLLYPLGGLQHAGILTGWRGGLVHDGLGAGSDEAGPERRWRRPRRVSAVTGAFLATTRTLFEALGGFDAVSLPVAYSDVDFCFRARKAGKETLWDAELALLHRESATRGPEHRRPEDAARAEAERAAFMARWPEAAEPDPWLNPAYADLGRPGQHVRAISAEAAARYLCDRGARLPASSSGGEHGAL